MIKLGFSCRMQCWRGPASLAFAAIAVPPCAAQTNVCLLDSSNDGNANANVDTDGSTDSAGIDERLACGVAAVVAGLFGTPLCGVAQKKLV